MFHVAQATQEGYIVSAFSWSEVVVHGTASVSLRLAGFWGEVLLFGMLAFLPRAGYFGIPYCFGRAFVALGSQDFSGLPQADIGRFLTMAAVVVLLGTAATLFVNGHLRPNGAAET